VSTVPRNAIIRQIRLEAHKIYLLSLLAAFRHLNNLLSSSSLLQILHPFVPPGIANALKTGPDYTQTQRTAAFLRGLRELVALWSSKWKETKRGWRRPRWVDTADLGKVPLSLFYGDESGTLILDSGTCGFNTLYFTGHAGAIR
jgi:hypothetical protein